MDYFVDGETGAAVIGHWNDMVDLLNTVDISLSTTVGSVGLLTSGLNAAITTLGTLSTNYASHIVETNPHPAAKVIAQWNANQIQSIPVSISTITIGQVLSFDGVAFVGATPATGGGGGSVDTAANYNWTGQHTFQNSLTITTIATNHLVGTNDTGKIVAKDLYSFVAGTNIIVTDDADGTITISVPQSLATTAAVTFSTLFLNSSPTTRLLHLSSTGKVLPTDLVTWVAGTTNQVTVTDDADGTITLSLPQNIHTGATPTFATLTLSSRTSGRVAYFTTSGAFTDSSTFTYNGSQLGLSVQGSTGGLLLGGDTTLYRADANALRTGGRILSDTYNAANWNQGLDKVVWLGTVDGGTNTTAGIRLGTDTNLYRSAANTLKTDDSLVVASNFTLDGGTITLSVDTNFVLSGGVNGVSFDTNVLSVDATNDRVGIGTAAPTQRLHVYQDTNNTLTALVQNPNDGSSTQSKLILGTGTTTVRQWQLFANGAASTQGDSFAIYSTGANNYPFFANDDGQVHIWGTSPQSGYELTVTGESYFSSDMKVVGGLALGSASNTTDGRLVASEDIYCAGVISTDSGTTKYELGDYTGAPTTSTGYVSITINGTLYKFLVDNGGGGGGAPIP